jgi:hypothetical protein
MQQMQHVGMFRYRISKFTTPEQNQLGVWFSVAVKRNDDACAFYHSEHRLSLIRQINEAEFSVCELD